MIVTLVAYTMVNLPVLPIAGWIPQEFPIDSDITDADLLAEFAGRLCYQSWDRPNEKTKLNKNYLANIISSNHASVLEHASASFYIAEISRSLTHELIRHRHLSYSQLSQRYVDESAAKYIIPPNLNSSTTYDILDTVLRNTMEDAKRKYSSIVELLSQQGVSRKYARQVARSVLPNATETKLIVTGNMRAWREVIQKRNHPAADGEIQELAKQILKQLIAVAPNTMQDFI